MRLIRRALAVAVVGADDFFYTFNDEVTGDHTGGTFFDPPPMFRSTFEKALNHLLQDIQEKRLPAMIRKLSRRATPTTPT